jgi:4-alpha-glucanotransferase
VLIVGEDLGTVSDEIRETLHTFGILSYRLFYFEKWGDGRLRLPHEYAKQALVSISTHDLPTLAGFWEGRDIEARRNAGMLPSEDDYRRQRQQRMADKQKMLDALFALGLLSRNHSRRAADYPELTGDLHNAVVGFVATTPSALMLLNEEDLMKQCDQQNLPGTCDQYPNWRHKTRFTIEELGSRAARDFTEMYKGWLNVTARLNG